METPYTVPCAPQNKIQGGRQMLLYKTKHGQILTDEDIDFLDPYAVQELGIHIVDNEWDDWN